MSRRYWFFFFLVSGFCSLLYEVVWLRLAMASYGVTTPLVSIVLSTFMGGLALGSWGAGVLMSRLAGRPVALGLRLYGAAEAITALSATVVPAILRWGHNVLAAQAGSGWGSAGYYRASAAFVALALLPFCTCMGATFPLGLFVLRGGDRRSEQGFSYLYLANVVGAAAGTLMTAFVLVELLGFAGTLALAALGNATISVVALALSLKAPNAAMPAPEGGDPAAERYGAADAASYPATAPVLAALFATGAASMGMEVVWLRQLTPYLGNLVYCFAAVLFLYLVATVAGASVYRGWLRRRATARLGGVPTWMWAVIGLCALLPLVAADPRWAMLNGRARFLRAPLAVAPFSAALGFITPLLMDRWSAADPKRAGIAYGWNIVGCILGPLLAGFILLPRFGERGSLLLLSLPLFLGALLSPIGGAGRTAPAHREMAVSAAALLVGLAMFHFSRGPETTHGPGAVIRRDDTATVIAKGTGMDKRILVNGVGMTFLTPITKLMAHLPLAFREKPARRALVICFGMGTTFRSARSWGVETTAVELIPSVPELFSYFHADAAAVMQSPQAHIVIDDGRRFLERSSESFDVVVIDPPPPVEAAGSSLLYSRELYEAVRRRMTDDGILQQWIPAGDPLVGSAFLKAVLVSFPYVRTFGSIEGWGVHVLASMRPIPPASVDTLVARVPAAAARDIVEWGPFSTATEQLAAVLKNEVPPQQFVAAARHAPVLVDDRPLNEYFLIRRQLAAWRGLHTHP